MSSFLYKPLSCVHYIYCSMLEFCKPLLNHCTSLSSLCKTFEFSTSHSLVSILATAACSNSVSRSWTIVPASPVYVKRLLSVQATLLCNYSSMLNLWKPLLSHYCTSLSSLCKPCFLYKPLSCVHSCYCSMLEFCKPLLNHCSSLSSLCKTFAFCTSHSLVSILSSAAWRSSVSRSWTIVPACPVYVKFLLFVQAALLCPFYCSYCSMLNFC